MLSIVSSNLIPRETKLIPPTIPTSKRMRKQIIFIMHPEEQSSWTSVNLKQQQIPQLKGPIC